MKKKKKPNITETESVALQYLQYLHPHSNGTFDFYLRYQQLSKELRLMENPDKPVIFLQVLFEWQLSMDCARTPSTLRGLAMAYEKLVGKPITIEQLGRWVYEKSTVQEYEKFMKERMFSVDMLTHVQNRRLELLFKGNYKAVKDYLDEFKAFMNSGKEKIVAPVEEQVFDNSGQAALTRAEELLSRYAHSFEEDGL